MARLPPPVTMITSSIPLAIASSTPYWMVGLSTKGSISFGWALVTGKKRVPRPAAGKMALRTRPVVIEDNLNGEHLRSHKTWHRRSPRARRRRRPDHQSRRWQRHFCDPGDDRVDGDHVPPLVGEPSARRSHHGRI